MSQIGLVWRVAPLFLAALPYDAIAANLLDVAMTAQPVRRTARTNLYHCQPVRFLKSTARTAVSCVSYLTWTLSNLRRSRAPLWNKGETIELGRKTQAWVPVSLYWRQTATTQATAPSKNRTVARLSAAVFVVLAVLFAAATRPVTSPRSAHRRRYQRVSRTPDIVLINRN